MRRRPNTQTVQWFLEIDAQGQLDLEPAYQRRSVWNQDYQRFFIDTVLRDFPAPPIYLQVETRPGAPTIYHVIDGKQRLESLLMFSRDGFHLGNYAEGLGLGDKEKYFSQLPDKLRNQFVEYTLSVENISQAEPTELIEAFDRLNRNVAKLNDQELRNAQFSGVFITKMTLLAEDPFWTEIGVATRSRIRRMQDVEYVSELYVLTMHGVQDGKRTLDKYYAQYDEAIDGEDDNDARFRLVLDWLRGLPFDWRSTRYRNLGDLYGLWAAVLQLQEQGQLPAPSDAGAPLSAFEAALGALADDRSKAYSDAVRQGTNKDTNRELRARILAEVILEAAPAANP
jgi:hypothetical protein